MISEAVFNSPPITYAYIDPGTGSMLFTILIGLISVLAYGIKSLVNKIKILPTKSNKEHYPFVIYTDSKRYWNVFKSVCEQFEKGNTFVRYLTQSQDDPVFEMDYKFVFPEYIGNNNRAFSKLNYLSADVLLSTTPSLDVYQWKRSKDTKWYVHIPHMCNDITLYRLFGIDYYDSVLTSSDFQKHQIRELEQLRNLPSKELKTVGLTYFDEMKKKLDSCEKPNNVIPVVLLAPSWGPSSLLNVYGHELIDCLLKTGYQIIIRPHPQSYVSESELIDSMMEMYSDIEWNKDNDNFTVLNRADILISDFSGVLFDFALVFEKPVIYSDYRFDDSVYDAHWLNEQLWTETVLPKIGEKLNKEDLPIIKEIIDKCLNDSKYSENRKKVSAEAWKNKGRSAEGIYKYMILKQKEISGSE